MNRRLLKVKKPSLLCLLVIGVSAPLSTVQSGIVTIDNPGLETNPDVEKFIQPSTSTQHLPGWTYYNPDDINYFFGTYTPTIPGEYTNPPTNQIMFIDVENDNQPAGSDAWEAGFEQALTSTTLQAGTYDLSVAVGNPQSFGNFNYDGFGGYGIELIAGFTVDATANNNQLVGGTVLKDAKGDGTSIVEGLFAPISLSVFIPGDHALLGQALGIRLYNQNLKLDVASGEPLSGIGFDNVQLSLSPVPVPAAIWLFGTALLGLSGFNLRRKRAALSGSC